jgi:hypothetical protein
VIYEALRVLLFGMIGIFVVMGIIMLVLYVLKHFSKPDERVDLPPKQP